jgi:hypothetical protein
MRNTFAEVSMTISGCCWGESGKETVSCSVKRQSFDDDDPSDVLARSISESLMGIDPPRILQIVASIIVTLKEREAVSEYESGEYWVVVNNLLSSANDYCEFWRLHDQKLRAP